jgi:hypothetical protein
VDGTSLTVTRYTGWYAEDHNNDQQKINIYVPSNVTPDSAILLLVNNGGWRNDDFPATTIVDGFDYVTTGTSPSVTALGLDRGFVIVSYGARSRANPATDGEYLGHSPATMTDTKAAVRFVRYNYITRPGGQGQPDRIVVTAHSAAAPIGHHAAAVTARLFLPSMRSGGRINTTARELRTIPSITPIPTSATASPPILPTAHRDLHGGPGLELPTLRRDHASRQSTSTARRDLHRICRL